MNNQPSRPSRWGSKEEGRDRSHSFRDHDRQQPGRGYDTSGGCPPPFLRDGDRSDGDRYEGRREYDRGGDGRRDSRGAHDWRCMECGLFNDPRDDRCPRCGEWRPRGRDWDDRGRGGRDDYYGPPRSRDDDDDEHDRRSRKKSRHEPKKPEWPPAFEAGGAAYVFDVRSGMFYEPASDFFYDPKTKLYYSNKKQKYFRFAKGMDPEFEAVDDHQPGVGGATAHVGSTTVPIPDGSNTPAADDKSKIAISLKTTSLPSASASSAASERSKLIEKLRKASSAKPAASTVETQVDKKHAKDLDVWSNRIKEMKGEEAPIASQPTLSDPSTVKTTASGQPICVICRRKFANIEKLHQHEKLSALHKDNLAKKAASDAAKEKKAAASATAYRDRTKERQMLYAASSADATHVDKLLASVNSVGNAERKTEVVRPDQTLGDTNVGNQLLQKMGWKNGDALGRKQGEETAADANVGDTVANNLKNDWERIESMAQAGGQGRR